MPAVKTKSKSKKKVQVRTGRARSGDLDIYYEDWGDVKKPAMLLVMGLASQLTRWPESFCNDLVSRGYRVIRFDNRDVGLSSQASGQPGSVPLSFLGKIVGIPVKAPYRLHDMANDAMALLDHLKIKQAHVVGISMGGMISQLIAGEHSERVRSLTLMHTTTNDPSLPRAKLSVLWAIGGGKRPTNRDEAIERGVQIYSIIGSQAHRIPESELRERVAAHHDRGTHPAGVTRQQLAILASGSLRANAAKIAASTLVIHGAQDQLVPLACGRDCVGRIRGARMKIFNDLAHDLPEALLPEFASLIDENASA